MKYLLSLWLFVSSLAFAADPTLVITADVQKLAINGTTPLTFTFTEAVTGFDLTDIYVKGGGQVTGFAGSGAVYTATFQKLTDLNTASVIVDNNATTPAGHGATIGFNVQPKMYVKDSNLFNGKLIEAVPQPTCPKEGEILVNADNTPATPLNEKYYVLEKARRSTIPYEVKNACLTRVLAGQKYNKKVAPKTYETANVHGGHNHSTLMPKITTTELPRKIGTTAIRITPSNIQNGNPDGSGNYNRAGSGDFRAGNVAAYIAADDPIVYPNQKGAAHQHTFFGNASVNHETNSASLIKSCVSLFSGGRFNCTGYWMPSMVDTATSTALIPYGILIYYKAATYEFMPFIEPLPQGLKIIAGNPAANSALTQTDNVTYACFGGAGFSAVTKFIPNCAGGASYDSLRVNVEFPNCVADNGSGGMLLDSANHRSHLAYAHNNSVGNTPTTNGCPSAFPHRIAVISQIADYPIRVGQNTATFRLASDNYASSIAGGFSAHADWWGGWNQYFTGRVTEQCNKKIVDCGVNYIGLSDGIGITNITTSGNIATLTTEVPHLLLTSNGDGSYPKFLGVDAPLALMGRLSGVTGASASTYNFDPSKVTVTNGEYPNPAGTISPIGSQALKIINATQIEVTLPSSPATPINGAVNPAVVKLQWGEATCNIGDDCASEAYNNFYYGDKN